jgi:iron complex outermembrane recepter protein
MKLNAYRSTRASMAAIALATSAVAANAQAQDNAAGADGAGEIVVTARRSEESIQSTPVSVTAFNEELLRSASIAETSDLMMKTPGVYLSGSGGRENSVFQIRGQSKALSGSNAPGVVTYFADVPQPTFGSGVATYDMNSVQVLKGPQGTLFGRNTTGGAVLFYPKAPGYNLEGYVEAGYGRFDDKQLEGAITLPLAKDAVAIRIAGKYNKRDGWTKNLGLGGDLDDTNVRALRASLLVEPAAGVKNLTIFDWYRNNYTGDAVVLRSVSANPSLVDLLGVRTAITTFLAAQQARGPRVVDSDVSPAINRTRRWGLTNRTDIDLAENLRLTNIFGYRRTYVEYNINTDGVPLLLSSFGAPLTSLNAGAINHVEQYTDEVQLSGSAMDDKLDWLVGAFYLHSKPYGPTGTGNSIGAAVIPGLIPARNFETFQYNFYTEKSKAVFANVNIRLDGVATGLRLNAGVRHTWDKVSACVATDNTTQGALSAADCAAGAAPLIGASINRTSSKAPTWTLGLDWQVNSDLFAYVVTRRGYRSGGVNSPTFGGTLVPLQGFGPERVTDVEAGIRSEWDLGGGAKARLNVSGFMGFYDGVQIALSGLFTNAACVAGDPVFGRAPFTPDGDCNPNNDPQTGTMLANAGKSKVSGIDIDAMLAPTENLTFTFAANFMDTKTRSFSAPASLTPYIPNGEIPFDMVAKRTFTLGAQYRLPLGDLGELVANADYYRSSKLSFVDDFLPAYGIANFRLSLNEVGGRPVDVSLYMTNAFDRKYAAIGAVSGSGLGYHTAIYGAPRQFGAAVRYRFGK